MVRSVTSTVSFRRGSSAASTLLRGNPLQRNLLLHAATLTWDPRLPNGRAQTQMRHRTKMELETRPLHPEQQRPSVLNPSMVMSLLFPSGAR